MLGYVAFTAASASSQFEPSNNHMLIKLLANSFACTVLNLTPAPAAAVALLRLRSWGCAFSAAAAAALLRLHLSRFCAPAAALLRVRSCSWKLEDEVGGGRFKLMRT